MCMYYYHVIKQSPEQISSRKHSLHVLVPMAVYTSQGSRMKTFLDCDNLARVESFVLIVKPNKSLE